MSAAAPIALPLAIPAGALATVREDTAALFALLTGSRLNALLVCVPLGCLSQYLVWSPLLRFTLVRAGILTVMAQVKIAVELGVKSGSRQGKDQAKRWALPALRQPQPLLHWHLILVYARRLWFRERNPASVLPVPSLLRVSSLRA